ncbi:hypothetical protein ETD83_29280, partial [Actinomadura soli]
MTAGATVLGIAAMSGVSHAETSQPSATSTSRPLLSLDLGPTTSSKAVEASGSGLNLDLGLGVGVGAPKGGGSGGVRVDAGVKASLNGGSATRQGNRTAAAAEEPGLSVGANAGVAVGGTSVSANVSAKACVGGCQA